MAFDLCKYGLGLDVFHSLEFRNEKAPEQP